LAAEKNTLEVDPQHTIPLLFRQILEQAGRSLDSSIVHEDIQAAELLDRLLDHRGHITLLAHVGADGNGLAAHRFDLVNNRGAVGWLAAVDDHTV